MRTGAPDTGGRLSSGNAAGAAPETAPVPPGVPETIEGAGAWAGEAGAGAGAETGEGAGWDPEETLSLKAEGAEAAAAGTGPAPGAAAPELPRSGAVPGPFIPPAGAPVTEAAGAPTPPEAGAKATAGAGPSRYTGSSWRISAPQEGQRLRVRGLSVPQEGQIRTQRRLEKPPSTAPGAPEAGDGEHPGTEPAGGTAAGEGTGAGAGAGDGAKAGAAPAPVTEAPLETAGGTAAPGWEAAAGEREGAAAAPGSTGPWKVDPAGEAAFRAMMEAFPLPCRISSIWAWGRNAAATADRSAPHLTHSGSAGLPGYPHSLHTLTLGISHSVKPGFRNKKP